jgi:DMSO/TMAO reductase YedYZ molybdopterin-dependent catalytic subunit
MLVVLITALAISGCTSPTPTAVPTAAPTATPTPAPSGPTVLTVDGKVNTPLSLSLDDLKGYTQATAGWVNNAGNASYNGTGPKLLDILNKAGLQGGAANITFTSSDNYTSSMTLADLNGMYNDTIVAWDWTGVDKNGVKLTNTNNTLQLIVPAGGNKNQAKMLARITVS